MQHDIIDAEGVDHAASFTSAAVSDELQGHLSGPAEVYCRGCVALEKCTAAWCHPGDMLSWQLDL
jgi:hypothetical protein